MTALLKDRPSCCVHHNSLVSCGYTVEFCGDHGFRYRLAFCSSSVLCLLSRYQFRAQDTRCEMCLFSEGKKQVKFCMCVLP